jgi:hypothetical protein
MKRFMVWAIALVFLFCTSVIAAEKAATPAVPATPAAKAEPAKAEKKDKKAAGKVLEISDTILKIERTLKGKAEIMEFILEKPIPNIAVGDQIKVSYLEKEGRNVLILVAPAQKTAAQKAAAKKAAEKKAAEKKAAEKKAAEKKAAEKKAAEKKAAPAPAPAPVTAPPATK